MKARRNPVAKYNNEFNKPRTFRDRKKSPSKKEEQVSLQKELHHPVHQPYHRTHKNWTKEALDAEDIFRGDDEDDGLDEQEPDYHGCYDGFCAADPSRD